MEYKVRFKKGMFWKSVVAMGHKLDKELDRMDIYLKDGSILSVAGWSRYDMNLGLDWVLSTRKRMEQESGQDIKLNI